MNPLDPAVRQSAKLKHKTMKKERHYNNNTWKTKVKDADKNARNFSNKSSKYTGKEARRIYKRFLRKIRQYNARIERNLIKKRENLWTITQNATRTKIKTRLLNAKLNKKCQVNLKKLIFPEGVQTVIVPNMYRKIKQNYCEDCDYTYTDKSSFNKHLRAKHKDKVASMEFQCKQCDRGFMKKHHLQTHISMVHNKIQRGDSTQPKNQREVPNIIQLETNRSRSIQTSYLDINSIQTPKPLCYNPSVINEELDLVEVTVFTGH